MKTKIICLILSLVFVIGAFCVNGTYAWFMTYGGGSGKGVSHNFISGNIGYNLVGGFIEDTVIKPEINLLTGLEALPENLAEDTRLYMVPITLEEDVSAEDKVQKYVDTQIRLKVFYTYIDAAGKMTDGQSIVGVSENDNLPFVAKLAKDTKDNVYWTYNEQDEYFYYTNPDGSDVIKGGLEAVDPIPLFSALYYSGKNSELPTAVFKNQNSFTVKVVFQAKQANFVDWTTIGEINFDESATETPGETVSASDTQ